MLTIVLIKGKRMPETKCKICGKLKIWHKPPNLNCPEGKGIKSMGVMFYDSYSETTFESSIVKKARIKVSSSKAKGRNLQNDIAKKIGELLNIPVERDGEIVGREMGQSGTDIRLSKAVLKLFPYSVEAKAGNSFSFKSAVEQARKNILPNTNWLLVTRRDRDKAIVSIDCDVFFELLKKNLD